jgi:hypothetical protein
METKPNEVCYTTRSGLRIGSQYQRYQPAGMTQNDIMWQGVLLGIEPDWTRKRVVGWILYALAMAFGWYAMGAIKND